jgi:hypothetical protein
MELVKRKKKVADCEAKLKAALRRLTITNTVVRRWQARLRTQERALLKELEAQVDGRVTTRREGRKFLEE